MTPDSVHLLTRSSQMTLCKDEQGRVRRAYYGPRLHQPEDALENAADAPLLYSSLADSVTGLPNASGEYCICVTQADGALSLSLECQGWEVLELDDDREEAVFYGKDPSYPVRVEIHVRSHRESDTFLQWAVVRNEGKEGIRLHRAASAQLGLRAERYFVTSFRGTWGGESLMSEEEVARGHELALVSGTGTRTAQEGSPGFIISLDGPAREDSGEVVLGALAWSGNYRIWFRHSPYHYLFAGAGLDTAPAPYLLDGGGVFETPPLILTHSKNGKGEASRRIHCWARRYGLRGGGTERPTLLNSWEGVYFTFTEKVLHGMMKRAADLGIELFVLDDGWFGNRFPRNDARAGLGDWQVNRAKLPHGLEGLIRHAEELGIRFGIWVEPEEFQKRLENGSYTIALAPVQAEGGSVYTALAQFSPTGGGLTDYSDALYTTQLSASATATGSTRCSLLAACERQLLEQAVAVPLFTQQKRLLVANGIEGLVFDPFGPVLDVTYATKS